MSGPNDDDVKRAAAAARKARETAAMLGPSVAAGKLNPLLLKGVLDKHAPGNDAEGDGIYATQWLEAATFYRFTEEYVPLENRAAYKQELERSFPKKAGF